ncbi:hypothetical protein BGX23_002379 [Mortierella sp. AD031]|nr:hypothetical protein BGX23_002379 [Mortierella sp. AD031]
MDLRIFFAFTIEHPSGIVLDVIVKRKSTKEDSAPSLETPQRENTASSPTVRRNPVYGLVEESLENYTHIDIPKTSAPGPQLFPDNNKDDSEGSPKVQQPNNNHTLRVPQFTPESVSQSTDESNLEDTMAQTTLEDTDGKSCDDIRVLAEQGNAEAQYRTGLQFEKGHSAAMDWYTKAAEQGYAYGQTNVGVIHEMGRGAPKDKVKAMEYYRKAADQGNQLAINHLKAESNPFYWALKKLLV